MITSEQWADGLNKHLGELKAQKNGKEAWKLRPSWEGTVTELSCTLAKTELSPGRNMALSLLLMCWKNSVPGDLVHRILKDPNATAMFLARDIGFVFKNGGDSGKEKYCYKILDGDGRKATYWEVVAWSSDGMSLGHHRFDCDKAHLKKFLSGKVDPFTMSGKKLEVDHRTPVAACRIDGRAPAVLTNESIDNGTAEEEFQVLSSSMNSLKREACTTCLRTNTISVPPCLAGRMRWPTSREGTCVGCVWHNPCRK